MKKFFIVLSVTGFLTACNSSGSTSEDKKDTGSGGSMSTMSSTDNKAETNRQTALASVQGVNAHDVGAMFKDVAPDAVDYGDGSMTPMKNLDSVKMFVGQWLKSYPDVKGESLDALSNADGSKVIVIGEWSGTFKNDFMGMKATNKSYKTWDGDIFTFNDAGKITSHRSIQSNMTMMTMVGAKMSK